MAQVQARKDKIVKGLTGGVELLFKKNKIDWIKGSGRLAGKGNVEVTDGQTADARPPARRSSSPPGRSRAACPASRSTASGSSPATKRSGCARCPKSIAIMGSGAVGVEFASIFRRFGSEVTIIELLPRLVPIEDEAVSAELERSFKKQGIKVLTGDQGHLREGRRRRRRPRGPGAPTARPPRSRPTTCWSRPAAAR